jgi:hypothetical protein
MDGRPPREEVIDMRYRAQFVSLAGVLLLSACGGDASDEVAANATAPVTRASADAGTALVEARRCGRAIAVAARCNYLRDDRDVAALRFSVLQGLDQRYGDVVDQARLTEAVDLAVLDRMATIGQCSIQSGDVAVVQEGLRDVLGSCTAP